MKKNLHGGDLQAAEKKFGRSAGDWLDLSTGISPWTYPIGVIPDAVWNTLPYDHSSLITSAARYYQCSEKLITPIPGSQDAIRRLPYLLSLKKSPATVAIPAIGYQEHRVSWQSAGHTVFLYSSVSHLMSLVDQGRVEHAVIVNPNNPSAELVEPSDCLKVARALSDRGYLIIDEAFMDFYPDSRFSAFDNNTNVIVLRSIGKFFGLAGLRLGFLLGSGAVIEQLRSDLMPWGVSHPALWVGAKALADKEWQETQRQRIRHQAQWLTALLKQRFSNCRIVSLGLFSTVLGDPVALHQVYLSAAKAGILLRYDTISDSQAWLRIGLSANQERLLEQCLKNLF